MRSKQPAGNTRGQSRRQAAALGLAEFVFQFRLLHRAVRLTAFEYRAIGFEDRVDDLAAAIAANARLEDGFVAVRCENCERTVEVEHSRTVDGPLRIACSWH